MKSSSSRLIHHRHHCSSHHLIAFALAVIERNNNNNNKEFVLVHEKKNRGWWLPGGGVDHNETIHEAAKRECKEEANIDIILTGILRIEISCYGGRLRIIYKAKPKQPTNNTNNNTKIIKAIPDKESKGARWCTFHDCAVLATNSRSSGDDDHNDTTTTQTSSLITNNNNPFYPDYETELWLRGPEPYYWFQYLSNNTNTNNRSGVVTAPMDFFVCRNLDREEEEQKQQQQQQQQQGNNNNDDNNNKFSAEVPNITFDQQQQQQQHQQQHNHTNQRCISDTIQCFHIMIVNNVNNPTLYYYNIPNGIVLSSKIGFQGTAQSILGTQYKITKIVQIEHFIRQRQQRQRQSYNNNNNNNTNQLACLRVCFLAVPVNMNIIEKKSITNYEKEKEEEHNNNNNNNTSSSSLWLTTEEFYSKLRTENNENEEETSLSIQQQKQQAKSSSGNNNNAEKNSTKEEAETTSHNMMMSSLLLLFPKWNALNAFERVFKGQVEPLGVLVTKESEPP